ncbi:lysophospholipid acyltransferase family protein [Lichenicoccus sp.]|uniref:lysophospholipid acyltransferase family protein n=1 Tax=Lichenicoccus sp. TaxID=2781899 RepID=UPI003D0C17A7
MILVRAALFNLYFVLLTLGMGLLAFWVRLFGPRHALRYATLWCRLSVAGLQRICGIRIALTGREHLPSGPVLIASQHQSAFDTLVWLTLLPRPAYVMKRELTRLPLVGPMLLLAGMIPVDREAGATALRNLLRETGRAVADGRQIVIFPEGTRVAAGGTVALQPGIAALAAHTGLPVVPVATDSGRCWSRQAFIKRPGTIRIAIAPPLPAGLRRQALLDAIRDAWQVEETRMGGAATRHAMLQCNLVDNSVGGQSARI